MKRLRPPTSTHLRSRKVPWTVRRYEITLPWVTGEGLTFLHVVGIMPSAFRSLYCVQMRSVFAVRLGVYLGFILPVMCISRGNQANNKNAAGIAAQGFAEMHETRQNK